MTEQEYINVSDRVNLSRAKQALMDIIPASSKVIVESEFKQVVAFIATWEKELFEVGNIDEESSSEIEPELDRYNCPIAASNGVLSCDLYFYQCDSNGEVAISHCGHQDNHSEYEGNCTADLCPRFIKGSIVVNSEGMPEVRK